MAGSKFLVRWLLLAAVLLALGGCAQDSAPRVVAGEGAVSSDNAPTNEADLPPAPEEAAAKPQPTVTQVVRKVNPDGSLPPASAGTNGAYDPPSASQQKKLAARIHPPAGLFPVERSAILLGGTAIAPPGAPDSVKGAISAANALVGQPYRWGGGHGSFQSAGYDCSGAVSYALKGGGLIDIPRTSGELMGWGVPGPGKWITLYASPSHTYAVIAGLRFDTVGDARGSGPRWHPFDAYPSGFQVRHLPGL
jgi:hypothetical protein